MDPAEIGRWREVFEHELRAGRTPDVIVFLLEHRLPEDPALVAELQKSARELKNALPARLSDRAQELDLAGPTQAMPTNLARLMAVGPYRLLQKLGEGGMGTVYLAEQTEPVRRRVALKIIKPGMDTQQVIARFEAERQALALMDHPNIARVFDAGTTPEGAPYFVMELVKGVPITKYCDENRLSPRERLELFVPVCNAVQHAHQKGIIHRDLKPTNVLVAVVDDHPVAKIIDFGLAKAVSQKLTEQTVFTQIGQIVGTIDYMSPEQAAMNQYDIDTRTDIYSLGVLLYELLTGDTPFDRKRLHQAAFDELLRIIRQEEPPRPSVRLSSHESLPTIAANRQTEPRKLSLLVRGELDWIVMKALEKDRTRRYETANGLGLDVQRYLADEPVAACPPSASYQFQKLLRRHRGLVITSGLVAAALLLGIIGTTWQAIRAGNEAQRADDRAADALREKTRADEKTRDALEEKRRADEKTAEALTAKRLSDRHLYISHTHQAASAWEERNIGGVRDLLARWQPAAGQEDMRGFEWYYLDRLCRGELLTFKGHTSSVSSVAFSPDGTRLASGGADNQIKVWDVATGREITTLAGHAGTILSVVFSPNGTQLASASEDETIKLWDLVAGRETATVKLAARPSPFYRYWDRSPFKLKTTMAFSPDGAQLASAVFDGEVILWNVANSREISRLAGTVGDALSPVSSQPGAQFTVLSKNGDIKLWDVATGQETPAVSRNWVTGAPFTSVALSPDGKLLAVARTNTIELWDVEKGQATATLQGHTSIVKTMSFSPDSAQLASASEGNPIKVWDVATGKTTATLAAGGNCVAFSADGTRLAAIGQDHTVTLWDTTIRQEPITFPVERYVESLVFTTDGTRLALEVNGGKINFLDVATGQETATFAGHVDRVTSVALSPDGKILASASEDGTIKVWDVATGKTTATLARQPRGVFIIAFSPDGTRLASAGLDRTIKLWDVATGQETAALAGHEQGVNSVVFSPDGALLASASNDRTIKLWDVATGQETAALAGQPRGVFIIAFSPDGTRLASAGLDPTIELWDVPTGRETAALAGHADKVTSVAFSPDGARLASASRDRTIKLWDVATGQETATLAGHVDRVTSVAFNPDGTILASASRDRTIKLWDARPWTPEVRDEQWALGYVRFHLKKGLTLDPLLDKITRDKTIPDAVRQRALAFTRQLAPASQ